MTRMRQDKGAGTKRVRVFFSGAVCLHSNVMPVSQSGIECNKGLGSPMGMQLQTLMRGNKTERKTGGEAIEQNWKPSIAISYAP